MQQEASGRVILLLDNTEGNEKTMLTTANEDPSAMHSLASLRTYAKMRTIAVMLCFATAVAGTNPAESEEQKSSISAAVFDFEFNNLNQEVDYGADNTVERSRLPTLSRLLKKMLKASGRVEVVDTRPAADRVNSVKFFHDCQGCDADIAKGLGADLAITAVVVKVSNMEGSMRVYVRNSKTGQLIAAYPVEYRGNSEYEWSRAVSWLVRNRLLHPDYTFLPTK